MFSRSPAETPRTRRRPRVEQQPPSPLCLGMSPDLSPIGIPWTWWRPRPEQQVVGPLAYLFSR
jgi:hypothetical protein